MKTHPSRLSTLLTAITLGLVAATSSNAAVVITPTGVTATSWYNAATSPGSLIDGNNFTDTGDPLTSTHGGGNSGHWHAGSGTPGAGAPSSVAAQELVFDLGGTYNLTKSFIWNINQTSLQTRGVENFNILVSSDGSNFTSLGAYTLAIGSGAVEVENTVASGVTHVKFDIQSAISGSTTEYVGLSEVRFEGTLVPEPSSALLACLGALALLRRRR